MMAPLPKEKILIVDDMPADIHILGEELRKDHEVLLATNGPKGLELAAKKSPDLIILDVMMPEMDGYEVCRRLKENPGTKNIPVIFVTAENQQSDELQGLEIGAVDYIHKPFCPPIVTKRVKTQLNQKKTIATLEKQVTLDELTHIPNRRGFDKHLAQEWKRAKRSSSPLSIIMVDLDCFKQFNDTYGHIAGDDCLRKVAFMLDAAVRRPGDYMARYGGEEFAAILPETDLAAAVGVAALMQDKVASLHILHDSSWATDIVSLSIGVATTVPGNTQTATDLLKAADDQLFIAKKQGRNRISAQAWH